MKGFCNRDRIRQKGEQFTSCMLQLQFTRNLKPQTFRGQFKTKLKVLTKYTSQT